MDRISKAINEAKASLEIEGMFLPEGAEPLIEKRLRGEMSQEEFVQKAMELAENRKRG